VPILPHEQQLVSLLFAEAQSAFDVQRRTVYVWFWHVSEAGALSTHDAAAVQDDVNELAVQLGTVPAPVSFSVPQQTCPPVHSPVSAPPSVPFDPTQSRALPLDGHLTPPSPGASQAAV
jgi:hypothetical protein